MPILILTTPTNYSAMDLIITKQIEKEFAHVDSIISAHTNSAIAKVNAEILQTYWEVGEYISQRLKDSNWGTHVVGELADYLKRQHPQRRGYSKRNLYNMVKFFDTYSNVEFPALIANLKLDEFVQSQTAQIAASPIVQLPTAQFSNVQLPMVLCLTTFTNHVEIVNRCNSFDERIFYTLYAAHNHLKTEELRRCIVNHTYESIMSKEKQMSPAMLSQYPGVEFMLKDKVFVDFLGLKQQHNEHHLHAAILEHMKQFILELGKDFLFVDSEYQVVVGGKQKRIDLLFYHRALQCLVAVELKSVDFEAEFVSKLDLYLEALDRDYKKPNENPSMGIILCPSADKSEVEYTLNRSMSPTMVAEYRRVLIPETVMQHSLAEYCEFLKNKFPDTNK